MVSVSECFSESYAEARPKFCAAARVASVAARSPSKAARRVIPACRSMTARIMATCT